MTTHLEQDTAAAERERKHVVVLDYGSGNLRSAVRAVERAGAEVTLTGDRHAAEAADGLVVPGVGAYAACMAGLRAVDGPRAIGRRLSGGRPVLGVCVGMQVLFERGLEHGVETEGCAEWPGLVERLQAPVVPHMGWNTVEWPAGTRLGAGLDADTRFYFVHSYAGPVTIDGAAGVRVDVSAEVPALGLWGPGVRLRLSGHAVEETPP